VTASDLSLQFQILSEPFLLLREIELHVRQLMRGKITADDFLLLQNQPRVDRPPQDLADLTFGEYVRLFEHPQIWRKLNLRIDRVVLTKLLQEVRKVRNDVMHFDPDPMTPDELGILKEGCSSDAGGIHTRAVSFPWLIPRRDGHRSVGSYVAHPSLASSRPRSPKGQSSIPFGRMPCSRRLRSPSRKDRRSAPSRAA
jgi:hypothetical protein